MISQALALVLVAARTFQGADAGFEPVVLDVHHGEVFTTLADGGSSDAPTALVGGTYMDDATTMWVAENKARARGAASVGPDVDLRTVTIVGAVMFGLGVIVGGALVFAWKR